MAARAARRGGTARRCLIPTASSSACPAPGRIATGVTRDIQIAQVAQNKFSDIEIVTPPVPDAFTRTYRYPYPDKILDGQNWADFQGRNDPVDSDLPADVVNLQPPRDLGRSRRGTLGPTPLPTTSTTTSSSSSIFSRTRRTNRSATSTLRPRPRCRPTRTTLSDIWGTYYGATYAKYAAGDPSADSMRIYYAWDGDQTSSEPTIDTRGKPDAQFGNFQEAQFTGFAVLHADVSAEDDSDDPAQPWKAGWSQRELAPDLNVAGHEGHLCLPLRRVGPE